MPRQNGKDIKTGCRINFGVITYKLGLKMMITPVKISSKRLLFTSYCFQKPFNLLRDYDTL